MGIQKIIKRLLLGFVFLFSVAFSANLDVSFSPAFQSVGALPQGQSGIFVYECTVECAGATDDITIDTIVLANSAPVQFSGNGINKISIQMKMEDDYSYSEISSSPKTFASSETQWIFTNIGATLDHDDDEEDGVTFRFYYDVADDAPMEATANFELLAIEDSSGNTVNIVSYQSKTFPISGLVAQLTPSYTPTVLVPGLDEVIYSYLSITPRGESFQDEIVVGIFNDGENFDLGNQNMGITEVAVYQDVSPNGVFSKQVDSYLVSIKDSAITENNQVYLTFDVNDFTDGITKNFFILYDIGKETDIGSQINDLTSVGASLESKKIHFQINMIKATGDQSGQDYAIRLQDNLPSQPQDSNYTSRLGGVMLDEFQSIIPPSNIPVGADLVPMAAFSLSARELDVTLNEMTFENIGDVPYVTTEYGENGIKSLYIFKDLNRNREFDGVSNEQLLDIWELGKVTNSYGEINGATKVTVTGFDIVIPSVNLDSDTVNDVKASQQRFLICYEVGDGIAGSSVAEEIGPHADLNLADAYSSSGLVFDDFYMSGYTSTSNVVAYIKDMTVDISEVKSISPPLSIRQSRDVPLFSYVLDASMIAKGVSVKLDSLNNDFKSNNAGITKLSLYYDDDDDDVFERSDTLMGEILSFDDTSYTSLPAVDLPANSPRRFFVTATLGSNAPIDRLLNFQVSDIVSTFNFGADFDATGVLPQPFSPATLNVTANSVAVESVLITDNAIVQGDTVHFVDILLRNDSAYSVTINNVLPKFYVSNFSGLDLSYEYRMNSSFSPVILAASSTVNFTVTFNASNIRTAESIAVDGYCEYVALGITEKIVLERKKTAGGGYAFSAESTDAFTASLGSDPKNFLLPAHIERAYVKDPSNVDIDVFDGDIIQSGSSLFLKLANSGYEVKGDSIMVTVNSESITNEQSADNYFAYDYDSGILTVLSLGSSDQGNIIVSMTDKLGNKFEEYSLTYSTTDQGFSIDDLNVYPNPYTPEKGKLKVGFNVTAACEKVTFYMYDHVGKKVMEHELNNIITHGYQLWEYDGKTDDGNYLATGVYLLYAVAESVEGEKEVARVKVAVW